MHGKQSAPNTPGAGDIASKAAAAGIKVLTPSMPWGAGGWEKINVTPDQVFAMIDGYANQLRAQGAQRIVVGGQSLGANVALAYATARRNVAGVVMAAPGHNPGGSYSRNASIKDNLDQACQLTRSGQGNQAFTGLDDNQGNSIRMSTAAVYCAWLSPRGMASMPVQARELPASIPVMLIIGTKDPSFGFAEANIYKPAAKNPYSRYLVIDGGDHRNTDHAASQRIVDWIKGLP
jgi:pimeloyl-ACP methyl ester carboxylesterase